jgi:hypothetical protein
MNPSIRKQNAIGKAILIVELTGCAVRLAGGLYEWFARQTRRLNMVLPVLLQYDLSLFPDEICSQKPNEISFDAQYRCGC